jgi:hypothetical protein
MKRCIAAVIVLLAAYANADSENIGSNETSAEEYPHALPFLAQKAIDAGEELPLPLGVSVTYYYVERDIDVKSVKASINDNPVAPVNDFFAADVRTYVHTATARMDIWIFPFLNVYGLFGFIDNTSEVDATFTLPDGEGGTFEYNLQADGGFEGSTKGVGTVLAAGYNDFFMTIDANWIETELGDAFSTNFRGQIYNGRAGWKGKIKGKNTRIWLGMAYWDTEREMSGTIDTGLPVGIKKINFEVVQGPENPVTYSTGFNYEFNPHWTLVADLGTNLDDYTALLSFGYRFP